MFRSNNVAPSNKISDLRIIFVFGKMTWCFTRKSGDCFTRIT
uniref:Uncharacterized protein n=1 Tax=Arundo donax TaxID=35708 RepID=A0A0A9BQF7_ARUDO